VTDDGTIVIRNAVTNNLQGIDLEIPRHQFVVITGVSGSGKSSLAFDTIYHEGARRYLETFSAYARQHLAKLERPAVDSITGLPPVIAVSQLSQGAGARSTVGTLSEVWDLLRLLYARAGTLHCPKCGATHLPPYPSDCSKCQSPLPTVERSLFSFNSTRGACPACNGRGTEDAVDPVLLVADENLNLRDGAMVPTLKRGYIVYSQVTMEVLNDICQAHGFTVDQPWKELTEEQKDVIFYGSTRLKVPFGKHPLESRLKWTGLTAKPREDGYYRGLIPTIEETLKRNRNDNVLRFVKSQPCTACRGGRLRAEALLITCGSLNPATLADLSLANLQLHLRNITWGATVNQIAAAILPRLDERISLLMELGLGYLPLSRPSLTLAPGERQRIRLATQALGGLQNVLYVLDEPSVGLHPSESDRLLTILFRLRDQGNTVLVVEHDPRIIGAADHVIELGPGAGPDGGQIIYQGPPRYRVATPTFDSATPLRPIVSVAPPARQASQNLAIATPPRTSYLAARAAADSAAALQFTGVTTNNLMNIDISIALGALNGVSGPSGSGKKSLLFDTLVPALRGQLGSRVTGGPYRELTGEFQTVKRVVIVDNSPIGRTPRSNAATYTKLWDVVRKAYSQLPEAKARGFAASHFSFNTKGGRCESCHGAGILQHGVFFLGDLPVVCFECGGKRFAPEILAVRYKKHSIADLLNLTVAEARSVLEDIPRARAILEALADVGLGYIPLGQHSNTLSGGEAQRVKLAAELATPSRHHTLYVLAEPTTGLHTTDVERLLKVLARIASAGHTVIAIEHDLQFLKACSNVIDLGPGSGDKGGRVLYQGPPSGLADCVASRTGQAMSEKSSPCPQSPASQPTLAPIRLLGVATHNLKWIDVDFPRHKLTVVTGPSGSGKSSLAFDTLYAESQRRFAEGLSTYARRYLQRLRPPRFVTADGLSPAIAVHQRSISSNPRSTLATVTDILDYLRLLWSRAGTPTGLTAAHFSFNRQEGACATCGGLGLMVSAAPDRLITHPHLSLLGGAMSGHRTGAFYGNPENQYIHILEAAGKHVGIDFANPWNELSDEARHIAMYGAKGDPIEATWEFDRKGRKGSHTWTSKWHGFVHYVDEEYARKHQTKKGDAMVHLLAERNCSVCSGERLNNDSASVRVAQQRLPDILRMSVDDALHFCRSKPPELNVAEEPFWDEITPGLVLRLQTLSRLGLGYLTLDRRAPTLSGGEARRVRLASQLGGQLFGITYVLDEPTVGLHPRDTKRLVEVLTRLRDEGNTVVVVEHDADLIAQADWTIELGPQGGARGGRLLRTGPPGDPARVVHQSPTASPIEPSSLVVTRASAQNLKGITPRFQTGTLNVVTGVSGSGKSTLLFDVLKPSLESDEAVGCEMVHVERPFAAILTVDDSPIGSTPASTPATYLGLLTILRKEFAATSAAKAEGFSASHFSYISAKGRCPECKGAGHQQVAMDFMADVWIPCEACAGRRYRPEVLAIELQQRTIADVLELTVAEAAGIFASNKRIAPILTTLAEMGLDYLPLGQSATTLSGGESQRLKLAAELARPTSRGRNLYLLDEPTRGLADSDVTKLLTVLFRLVTNGHTVIAVEHNLPFISAAAHIVDLGPEGGERGGYLLAQGCSKEVMACSDSATGKALRHYLMQSV
jgi:excinuclease ABC subunit A